MVICLFPGVNIDHLVKGEPDSCKVSIFPSVTEGKLIYKGLFHASNEEVLLSHWNEKVCCIGLFVGEGIGS